MTVTGSIEQAQRDGSVFTDSSSGDILLRALSNNNSWLIGAGSNTTSILKVNANAINFNAGYVTCAGNFGINNTTPQVALDIIGTINFTGQLTSNGTPWYSSPFLVNACNNAYITGAYVGVATSNPTYNLHVNGTTATSTLVVGSVFTPGTSTSNTLNIGTDSNTSYVNIGGNNTTVNIAGILQYAQATDLYISDSIVTLNHGGASGTAGGAGLMFEEGGSVTSYVKLSSDRNSFQFKVPNQSGFMKMNLSNNAINFNTNALVVNSNSYIGIGTSSPAYTLDVSGVINASSNILINGQALQAGYWLANGGVVNYSLSNVVIGSNASPNGTRLNLVNTTGTTNASGTGDMTNVTSNIVTFSDSAYSRIAHKSGNASISAIYNYESNKSVYWGESTDTGFYSFRGRNMCVGYATTGTGYYALDVNGTVNVADKLYATNNFSLGTTNLSEKLTIASGNIAMVQGGTYGGATSVDQWISIGNNTQTGAPLYQTSNYGITMAWSNDGCFFGLRNYSNRNDTVIAFGSDSNARLRLMYANSNDYMTILPSGYVGVGNSNPGYKLDVFGDINFTGILRQGGVAYVGSQWSNNSSNVFITGCNIGIGKTNPAYALDVAGTVNASSVYINGSALSVATGGGFTAITSNVTYTMCNVGFGKSNPTQALDVAGNINFSGVLMQNGTAYVGSQWSNNSSNLYITGSNVGIGTTIPQRMLHVSGDVQFDSNIYISKTMYLPGIRIAKNSNTGVQSVTTMVTSIPGYTFTSNNSNVGINNTSPLYQLDVTGTGHFSSNIFVGGTSTLNNQLNVYSSNQFPLVITTSNTWSSSFGINNSTLSNLNNGGGYQFNVGGASNTGYVNSFGIYNVQAGGYALTISSNNNIGIGTTNPAYILDVNGAINTTGGIVATGTSGTSAQVFNVTDGTTVTGTSKTYKLGYVANNQTGSFVVKGHLCYISQPEEFTIAFSFGGGVLYTPSLVLQTNMTASYSPFRNNQITLFGLLDANNTTHVYLKNTSAYITSTFNVSCCQYNGGFKLYQNKVISGLTTWTAADFKANDPDVAATYSTLTTFTSANFTWMTMYDAGTGNVGIGTTTANYKLDVSGQVHANTGFVGPYGNLLSTNYGSTLSNGYNGAQDYLSINVTGGAGTTNAITCVRNSGVGIGNTMPSSALDVIGSFSAKNNNATSSNLIAYYPFDSSFNDASGYSYNLTAVGNPSFVQGRYGGAVFFNNPMNAYGTQYLINNTLGNSVANGGPITVSCWFNMTTSSGTTTQPVVYYLGTSYTQCGIGANVNCSSNQLVVVFCTASMSNVSYFTSTISANTMYHLVVTYDGSTITAYLNNSSIGSASVTGAFKYTGQLRIGDGGLTSGNYDGWVGWVDDFRIYNRVLTTAEITGLYSGSSGVGISYTGSNVGVNNALPQYPLDVSGNINCTGNISAGNLGMFRNRIINGDMRIAQRGTSLVSGTGTSSLVYCIDRFGINYNITTGGITQTQQTLSSTDIPYTYGFRYSYRVTASTACTNYTYVQPTHIIEGYNVADLNWGLSSGVPVTISFWMRTNVASGSVVPFTLRGWGLTMVYNYPITVTTSAGWQYVSFTIPAPPATGVWPQGINGAFECLFAGDYQHANATTSAWAANVCVGVPTQVSLWGTINNYIEITGFQLEKGTIATPFEFRPYSAELQLCQRYFYVYAAYANSYDPIGCGVTNYNSGILVVRHPVEMRTGATIALGNSTASSFYISNGNSDVTCTDLPSVGNSSSKIAYVSFPYTGMTGAQNALVRFGQTGIAGCYVGFSAEF